MPEYVAVMFESLIAVISVQTLRANDVEYLDIVEYVEATPKSLRLRKRILDATARKRAAA
jgi:predicted membrane GTPase involved in stress response